MKPNCIPPSLTDSGIFDCVARAIAATTSGARSVIVHNGVVSGINGKPRSSKICKRSTLSRRCSAMSQSHERRRTEAEKSEATDGVAVADITLDELGAAG